MIEALIACFAIGSLVTSYTNYYILNLKDESFILPLPIMYAWPMIDDKMQEQYSNEKSDFTRQISAFSAGHHGIGKHQSDTYSSLLASPGHFTRFYQFGIKH